MADHLDAQALLRLQQVMEGEYPVLLDTFLADSDERLRLLQVACQGGEAERLRRVAHSFKGSCSNMGAVLLAGLCRDLEDCAGREEMTKIPELIERIERELAIVRILYRAERQRFNA